MSNRPAISLVAVPGRRRLTIELAQEIERRGFAGIYSPSMFGNMSLCEALAWNTRTIPFGTAIAPIYARTVGDFAQSAAFMHEISGGRFRMGIGVAHGPSHVRMGVTPGKPLGDTRSFVERFRAQEGLGALPPIIIAALRKKMVALAGEISEGVVFANASLSHMAESLAALPAAKRRRSGVLHRQHAADLHQRRRGSGEGGEPPQPDALRVPAELPELLEGSRLRGGDDGDRTRHRGGAATTRCPGISATNGWRTTRCSARRRRCARAWRHGRRRECIRR